MNEPDPKKGDPATIVGLFHKHPGTVILIQERRMLVQEDLLLGSIHHVPDYLVCEKPGAAKGEQKFCHVMRDTHGVIRGFTRRKNSKKWHSSDPGKNLGVIVGKRQYEQKDPGAALP